MGISNSFITWNGYQGNPVPVSGIIPGNGSAENPVMTGAEIPIANDMFWLSAKSCPVADNDSNNADNSLIN